MLHNTFGENKYRHDNVRYKTNFEGDNITFKRPYDKQNLTLVIISY